MFCQVEQRRAALVQKSIATDNCQEIGEETGDATGTKFSQIFSATNEDSLPMAIAEVIDRNASNEFKASVNHCESR
jgi:hypothetical protein